MGEPARWLDRLCGLAGPAPSAMWVLAHPDDESVGAVSLLPRLPLAKFVYVTDGAPLDSRDAIAAGCPTRGDYASLRRKETFAALAAARIAGDRTEFIGYVDQEASFHLVGLTRWIEMLIRKHNPAVILTHPYEGGHPDHDATAFAVQVACRRIARRSGLGPVVVEFTSYHAGADGWAFGRFLPGRGAGPAIRIELDGPARELKRAMIECHSSQHNVLRLVPLVAESFRLAPEYDFTAAPHAGRLLYETFDWGITGRIWREIAGAALRELLASEPEPATALLPIL